MSRRPTAPARITLHGALGATVALLAFTGLAAAAVDAALHPGPARVRERPVGGSSAPAPPRRRSFHISMARRWARIAPGGHASFRVSIYQRKYRGVVTLRIASRLPNGARATITPTRTRGRRSALRITTRATTRPGAYTIAISAVRRMPAGMPRDAPRDGRRHMTIRLRLVVRRPFTSSVLVSGTVTGALAPGTSRAVDVHLANPFAHPLAVTRLRVRVSAVTAPLADALHPCTPRDFAVRPYRGPAVRLAKKQLRSLSDLRLPRDAWPQLVMINRATDQGGCKGASLSLAFGATARRARG